MGRSGARAALTVPRRLGSGTGMNAEAPRTASPLQGGCPEASLAWFSQGLKQPRRRKLPAQFLARERVSWVAASAVTLVTMLTMITTTTPPDR